MSKNNFGQYSKSMITDVPADLGSKEYAYYESTIPKFRDRAVYVYSFKKNQMIFASGWFDLLGYKDDEINMLTIVKTTAPRFSDFANELNDKALQFIKRQSEQLEEYSFSLELEKIHKNGTLIPLSSRVGVFKSNKGRVEEIIGISEVSKSLHFGKIMQYAAYGPEISMFEETLNKELFRHLAISKKEKEALSLSSKGLTFKEIADKLEVSQSAIEKRIFPMYKRFNVKSLTHLVSFAYSNHIIS